MTDKQLECWKTLPGAGDENRTRTISLGSTPIGSVMLCDLRRGLSASSRIDFCYPRELHVNCTVILT